MAICGNCGNESSFARTIFGETPELDRHECPKCAPDSFEIHNPSERKIWIGPEYAPNDYEKRYDSEGVYYVPKPEVTAEREAKLFIDTDEQTAYAKAVEEKRLNRRTEPMDTLEIANALEKADRLLRPLIEDQETAYDV